MNRVQLGTIEEDSKKAKVKEYGAACKKLFGITTPAAASRRRRDHPHDHGEHKLEDYFKTHLSWLSDDQKEQLKGLKAEGKQRSELQQKIIAYYQQLTGEAQEKAKAQLQGGCRELIKQILGDEKAKEIKQMRESGTPIVDIAKKIDEWVCSLCANIHLNI